MEVIGFWGIIAIIAAVLLLIAGVAITLWRDAQDRKMDRLADRLKRELKPIRIEPRQPARPDSTED